MNIKEISVHLLQEANKLAAKLLKPVVIYQPRFEVKVGDEKVNHLMMPLQDYVKNNPGEMENVILVAPPAIEDCIKPGILAYINGVG